MTRAIRKLCLIPVLAALTAVSLSMPRTADAGGIPPCQIYTDACPEEMYDCCCGFRQACLSSYDECLRFCGVIP